MVFPNDTRFKERVVCRNAAEFLKKLMLPSFQLSPRNYSHPAIYSYAQPVTAPLRPHVSSRDPRIEPIKLKFSYKNSR